VVDFLATQVGTYEPPTDNPERTPIYPESV
jgi:hypothetical protein